MDTILAILMSFTGAPAEVDYAGQFAQPGDIWMGGPSPCLNREVSPDDEIIAHRTLPCGTVVSIYNPSTGLTAIAKIGERGPYGACLDEDWVKGTPCHQWVVKKKASDPGVWRGSFDLTPAVGKAIGQRGVDLIIVTPMKRNARPNNQPKTTRPSS